MKTLIVDDERLARRRLSNILQSKMHLELFEANSGSDAVKKIESVRPDLVFLDIKMTDFSGFEVLNRIDSSLMPIVVFVTAYDNHALKAFEVEAIDYLLKPYKEERVLSALNRAFKKLEARKKEGDQKNLYDKLNILVEHYETSKNIESAFLEKIVLKVGKKYIFAATKEIKYIISSTYYAELFMINGKKHLYRTSMTALMQKLDSNKFLRLNRSTIIRIEEIKEVVSEGLGDYSVVMGDGQRFNVTKNYKNDFLKQLHLR
ncbi:LytTR family DNA-binding domain-containing protein [uncultured Croceitalea sp.]|uniref:LytR/AlgR family response regulator transcription factor n=1 Tax=uncultured Croceitalea sp. TaxID=1798908 RepID=UPI0033060DD6